METNQVFLDDAVLNTLNYGVIVFSKGGDLLKINTHAETLIVALCPNDIILSEEDFKTMLKLQWKQGLGHIEKIDQDINGLSIEIIKETVEIAEKDVTVIQMRNVTGQKKQIFDIHKQTSDLLWKIRSRITPIQNALSLLSEFDQDMEIADKNELIKNSRFEIWQLERYLDNFRDLSLMHGQFLAQAMVMERTNVEDLIHSAVKNILAFENFLGKTCVINYKIEAGLFVVGDPQRLLRIMESLVLNAMIYSAELPEILVTTAGTDAIVRIQIQDRGFGISQPDQGNIFQYGFRGVNAVKTDYNGMGCELFIARNILNAMIASISFQSKENEGSVFEVTCMRG